MRCLLRHAGSSFPSQMTFTYLIKLHIQELLCRKIKEAAIKSYLAANSCLPCLDRLSFVEMYKYLLLHLKFQSFLNEFTVSWEHATTHNVLHKYSLAD